MSGESTGQSMPTLPDLPDVPKVDDAAGLSRSGGGALSVADQGDDANSLLGTLNGGAGGSSVVRHESRTGILLLLAIIVAAGGILYTMRRMGMSAQLEKLDVKIDYPMDGTPGLDATERERLIKELEDSGRIVQVELRDIKMNPFAWEQAAKPIEPDETDEERDRRLAAERAREAMEKRQAEIEAALDKLDVRSIMGGRTPIANISGDVVRKGDVINDMFTVVEIKTRTVILEVDGKYIEIGELDAE